MGYEGVKETDTVKALERQVVKNPFLGNEPGNGRRLFSPEGVEKR